MARIGRVVASAVWLLVAASYAEGQQTLPTAPSASGLAAPQGGESHSMPAIAGSALPSGTPPSLTQDLTALGQFASAPRSSQPLFIDDAWSLQVLPDGLIYPSYLASVREPRFASVWNYEFDQGWMWDIALGGRVGILRYGSEKLPGNSRPNGWQLDIEGAAFPRLDLEHEGDVIATDYRFGIPLTYGYQRYQTKLAFYHLSSHLGDEYMLRFPDIERINYSRNAFVWGNSFYLTDDVRLYAEAAWSFYTDGGAEPWEFQFGIDYSPALPERGLRGTPFFAVNAHLRQEVDFGGNFVAQTGWQWRGMTGHLFRLGMQYFNGKSEEFEFFRKHEEKLGLGVWYDY